jgi:hypothetical protein
MHPELPDLAVLFASQSQQLDGERSIPLPRQPNEFSDPDVPSNVREDRTRNKIVDRLSLAAVRHCGHFAELRGTPKGVGLHAVIYFYVEPSADNRETQDVRVATRLLFDTAETANLVHLLRSLADLAEEYATTGLDPRVQLCNRAEPMSTEACFVGVGVSTVLSVTGAPVLPGAEALGLHLPYQGIALLVDGTEILLRSPGGLGPVDLQSTHTLNINGAPTRRWRSARPYVYMPESALKDAFTALDELYRVVAAAAQERSPNVGQRDVTEPGRRDVRDAAGRASRRKSDRSRR